MLPHPGLCHVGAGGMAGRDFRFAGAGSAELVPGETLLLGGREHLSSSLCLMDSHTLSVGTKQHWLPLIATNKSRMFVV